MRTRFGIARWVIAMMAVCLAGANAQASESDAGLQFQADRPAVLECLTPAGIERGRPEYPERPLKLRKGALIRVEISFDTRDAAPDVKVLDDRGDDDDDFLAFKRAVLDHVRHYRLPCQAAGNKTVLTQQFDFVPDARKIAVSPLKDAESPIKNGNCKVAAPSGTPQYPDFRLPLHRRSGNVDLELTFKQSGVAPALTVLYEADSALSESVLTWAKAYRLDCAEPLKEPLRALQHFRFRLPGQTEYAIKDLSLGVFLRGTDRAGWGKVQFDFKTMSCPFAVRLTLMQPYADNRVAELETYEANREPFLKWLKKLKYQLPTSAEPFLIGESLNVSVPCTVLDLS